MEKILYEILDQLKDHSKRFDNIDQRFDGIDQRLQNLEEAIQNNTTEFRSHFKHIHTKLDHHEEAFRLISDKLNENTTNTGVPNSKNSTH